MANSASSSSSLQTHQMLQQFIEALHAHTPEQIEASGKAVREQKRLTGEMQARWDEANETIAQANLLKAQLDAQANNQKTAAYTLAHREDRIASREKALDERIDAFNKIEVAQKNFGDSLAEREKKIARREETAAGLDTSLAAREALVREREDRIAWHKKRLAEHLATPLED